MIVDDEPHAVEGLKSLVKKDKRMELLAGLTDPREAVTFIKENHPDLVFLDIQMPGLNGFDVLKQLKEASVEPAVIFVTAYDRFAIDAIKHAAFDYLLKPIDQKEYQQSIDRFFSFLSKGQSPGLYRELLSAISPNRKIRFNTSGGFLLINMSDILYIQADWNYAKVYISRHRAETLTMNLGAVEKILPATSFVRINRSVIVNLDYLHRVKRFSRECILIKDGEEYVFSMPIIRIRQLEKML